MTLQEATEPFLTYGRVEKGYAAETQIKMSDCFRSWLLPHFGESQLEALGQLDILRFRQAMVDRGLGIARQYSVLMALKLFLKFCRAVLEIKCLDPDKITLPKRPRPLVQFLSNQEIASLRSNMNTRRLLDLRLRALFEVLLATGMRISEALSLNRDSIDANTCEAKIVGKGGKPRTVFFTPECLDWIQQYLRRRRDSHSALFVTYGNKPERLQRGDIPRFFKALGKRAGIEKHLTPHLLRHTFCTHLRDNGADISLIKDLAGHQEIETTARYYLGADTQTLKAAHTRYLRFTDQPV